MTQRTLAGILAVPLLIGLWVTAALVPLPYVTYEPGLTVNVLGDNDAGKPYAECEEPDEGFNDSHTCLMELIEDARKVLNLGDVGSEVEPSLLVSLDGGQRFLPAPSGVRMIFRNIEIDGEDGFGELHLNATHEGLITDIWTSREEHLDHNIGTDSQLVSDIVTRLVSLND